MRPLAAYISLFRAGEIFTIGATDGCGKLSSRAVALLSLRFVISLLRRMENWIMNRLLVWAISAGIFTTTILQAQVP
ncbi:MAG: hypothetical protein ACJ8KX_11875, partial [Chthoniobacterales bacterium]